MWERTTDRDVLDVQLAGDHLVIASGDAVSAVGERVVAWSLETGRNATLDLAGDVSWIAADPRSREVLVATPRSLAIHDVISGARLRSWSHAGSDAGALHPNAVLFATERRITIIDRRTDRVRAIALVEPVDVEACAFDHGACHALLARVRGSLVLVAVRTATAERIGRAASIRWVRALSTGFAIASESGVHVVADVEGRPSIRPRAGYGPIAVDADDRLWGLRDGSVAVLAPAS